VLAGSDVPFAYFHTLLYEVAELAMTAIFVTVLIVASAIEGYRFIRMKLRE